MNKKEEYWNRREGDELRKMALQDLFIPALNKYIDLSLKENDDKSAYKGLNYLYSMGYF